MRSHSTAQRSVATTTKEQTSPNAAAYKLIDSPQSAVANRHWYPGLCQSCAHETTCRFPREMDRPLMHCEEFEGIVAVETPPKRIQRNDAALAAVANRAWYPGLCSTCDKAESCKFPKPDGGVFHCEEYQ